MEALTTLLAEILRVHDILSETQEDQWEKGVSPPSKPGQSSPARQHPPRPVEDIVTNEPRYELRAAVLALHAAITEAERSLGTARRRAERTHARWKGLDVPRDSD